MLQKTVTLTEWCRERKKISLAEKQVKSAKCIIKPLIKLYINKWRAFHRDLSQNLFFVTFCDASEDKDKI